MPQIAIPEGFEVDPEAIGRVQDEQGLRGTYVAERAGMKIQRYSQIRTGYRSGSCSFDELIAIAVVLGVQPTKLLRAISAPAA